MIRRKLLLNLKLINVTIFLLFIFALSSCGPPKKYLLESDLYNSSNSGTIIGRITLQRFFGLGSYNSDGIGKLICFRNLENNEVFNYTFAHYFAMRLPEGSYEIACIGSSAGELTPKADSFKFSVQNGIVKYIGSIVGDRDLNRHVAKLSDQEKKGGFIYSMKGYGLSRPTKIFGSVYTVQNPIMHYIIDESDDIFPHIFVEFPSLKNEKIEKDFLR